MKPQNCPTCTGPVQLVPDGQGFHCPSCNARFGSTSPMQVSADAITIPGELVAEAMTMARPPKKPKDETPKNPFSKDFMSRFEMVGFLGKGAMGAVFLMRQLNLDRLVAVKAVKSAGLTEKENKRLLKEAKVIARLNHPHIRAIHDVGIDGHVPYMICEYVDGEPLAAKLKASGALPVPEALHIALGVLEGLAFAHQEGVVHRDLKPGNILLSKDGRPKLVDFGLATVQNMNSIETISGRILGTPRYMSPEQCEGGDTTPSSDLYAMGVLLFEMLTGQMPFEGPGPMNFMDQHIHAQPKRLSAVRPDLAPELDDIVAKALAKLPSDRFATAAEMGEQLMEVYAGLTPARFMSRPPGSRAGLSSQMTIAVAGTVLAERYELVRPLGHSALGETWLARDQALDGSEVAVRLVAPKVWGDAATRAVLVREAKTAMKLSHANVVRLIHLEPGPPPFLVSEYVEGPSLASELARRQAANARAYSPGEVLPFVEGLVAALDHAHARGVVHRDLKAENVVLEPGESSSTTPRITDFGLAAALSPSTADARADISALAALVHRMLTLSSPDAQLPPPVAAVLNAPATSAFAFLTAYRAALAELTPPKLRPSGLFKSLDSAPVTLDPLPPPSQGLTRLTLFQLITDEVFKDGVVEEWENRALVAMTEYLELKPEEARAVAYQSREKYEKGRLGSKRPLDARTLYSKALYFAHENGAITAEREWMLEGLRKLFAISAEDHETLLARVRAKLG